MKSITEWMEKTSILDAFELGNHSMNEIVNPYLQNIEKQCTIKNITLRFDNQIDLIICGNLQLEKLIFLKVISFCIYHSELDGSIDIALISGYEKYACLKISYKQFETISSSNSMDALSNIFNFTKIETNSIVTICNELLKKINGKVVFREITDFRFEIHLLIPKSIPTTFENIVSFENESNNQINKLIENNKNFSLKNKLVLIISSDDAYRWQLVRLVGIYVTVIDKRTVQEANQYLLDSYPDLIIVDLNVNYDEEFEFLKQIKEEKHTEHIPFYILKDEIGKDEGVKIINAGAESIIPKSFSPQDIFMHIVSYFNKYDKRIKKIVNDLIITDDVLENSTEYVFLNKLLLIIESNIASDELDMHLIMKELGMSKSSIYRKLKSVTGQSAGDFIKSVKMKKSLYLLKNTDLTIADISDQLGFNSASYFATVFKKHFGFSPSDLKNK
jgi:AraC-like DNA-binding protein